MVRIIYNLSLPFFLFIKIERRKLEMKLTNTAFRPVKCLEEDIEKLAPVEGYVLFTTDTRKIYACIDGEYKMMGGSSGVFYGNKYLTDEEKYGD